MRCFAAFLTFVLFVSIAAAQLPSPAVTPSAPILNPSAPLLLPQAGPIPVSPAPGFSPGSNLALLVQLDRPYSGYIKVSSAPLRAAIDQLGR
jgi:hypothetical protein